MPEKQHSKTRLKTLTQQQPFLQGFEMPHPTILDTDILSEMFKGNLTVRSKAAEYILWFSSYRYLGW